MYGNLPSTRAFADKFQVRAVLHPDSSFAATASRDGSTRVWKQTSTSPPSYDPTESSHGAQFKTCLAYIPPSKEFESGLFLSGGQDAVIEARQPTTTTEGSADALMVGHANQICALDVEPKAGWLVSGSWDKTAKVWQVGKWEVDVELENHTQTVWAVLAYDRETVVTGCADHAIRVFDVRGKMRISFDGKNIVRALAKLPPGHPSGAEIASASNDGAIRLWTLKGELIAELWGHESFIYSLAVLPSGEIVSSGEDRSVRIWQGTECVQVITLPAISVWTVAVSPDGDIIAGSSDKMARIFTREEARFADPAIQAEFDESVQSSAIHQQQVGGLNMSDMPGPEFLSQKSGTKEGQSQVIKDTDGQPTLYQWSMSQATWMKIGQVVDSAASGDKKMHNGKEYDYLFDINIEDGKPNLKLPYNIGQNAYEAATKFLQDNELPMTYLEETANFVIKNTEGATIGQQPSGGADPWGVENRYRPGDASSSYQPRPAAPKQPLPQKEYIPIVLGKPSQAMEQITKKNDQFGDTDIALTESELQDLNAITQQLSKYNFSGAPSLSSSSQLEKALPSLIKVATSWQPTSNRLAPLDMLRFLAAALKTWPATGGDEVDVVAQVLGAGILDEESAPSNPKVVMISVRLLSNLLYGGGKDLIEEHVDSIISSLKPVAALATSDSAIAIAYTTLCLNLAVYLTTNKKDPGMSAHWGLTLVEELSRLLTSFPAVNHAAGAASAAQSTEPAYRAVMALGTLIVGLNNAEVRMAAKQIFDVPAVLGKLKTEMYLNEPRFQSVVSQIQSALA